MYTPTNTSHGSGAHPLFVQESRLQKGPCHPRNHVMCSSEGRPSLLSLASQNAFPSQNPTGGPKGPSVSFPKQAEGGQCPLDPWCIAFCHLQSSQVLHGRLRCLGTCRLGRTDVGRTEADGRVGGWGVLVDLQRVLNMSDPPGPL